VGRATGVRRATPSRAPRAPLTDALKKPAAVVAILVALGGLARIANDEVLADTGTRASDALPLYLYGAAATEGLDPTQQASLARVYDERGMSVGAATFSTLYPATAGALMRPFGGLTWEAFTPIWRSILLIALATYGLSAAWLATGDRWTRAAWGGATVALLAWHPVSAECVRLGQVNMVLGALCAAAIAASVRDRGGLAGGLLAVGALVKLVPGALVIPLVAERRWRAAVAAAGIGALGLALTLPLAGIPRIAAAIGETMRFQSSIDPDWLVGRERAPEWMRILGFLRHSGLQGVTLGAALLVPALRPSRATSAGAMALVCAWLGADAAGFHVLYTPLAYPAVLWVATGRPVRFAAIGALFFGLSHLPGIAAEPRMVLFGLCAWAFAAVSLLEAAAAVPRAAIERDRPFRDGALALLGVLTGVSLVASIPGNGPVAAPLPEGETAPEGAGFIHPSDRVPGRVTALGAGIDRPASTLAKAGTIRDLQIHLRRAAIQWRALAARYPERASLFEARAKAVPSGELRDLSGREVRQWLLDERALLDQLRSDGLDAGELGTSLDAALKSGLADPDLESRIPAVQ
jgi:hypothetical protein